MCLSTWGPLRALSIVCGIQHDSPHCVVIWLFAQSICCSQHPSTCKYIDWCVPGRQHFVLQQLANYSKQCHFWGATIKSRFWRACLECDLMTLQRPWGINEDLCHLEVFWNCLSLTALLHVTCRASWSQALNQHLRLYSPRFTFT